MQARFDNTPSQDGFGRPSERSRYTPARSWCIRVKRHLRADSARVYEALLDPRAWQTWIAPEGALCRLYRFDPYPGGQVRYSLLHPPVDRLLESRLLEDGLLESGLLESGLFEGRLSAGTPSQGTRSAAPGSEMYRGWFSRLVARRKVVLLLEREAADPDSLGEMDLAFLLEETGNGTDLLVVHDRIPPGLACRANEPAWRSALAKLAAWVEADDA